MRPARTWLGPIVQRRLINTVSLHPTHESQQRWADVLSQPPLRIQPRRAIIDTYPEPYWSSNWEDADLTVPDYLAGFELTSHHGFFPALGRIRGFPNIEDVSLRFTPDCAGLDDGRLVSVEPSSLRRHVLGAFFEATAAHCRTPGNRRVRKLTVRNLQNVAHEDLTASDDFRDTMRGVKELHLQICTERDREISIALPEMRSFWPHLRARWLEPVADQLEALTLYWDNHWGVVPPMDLRGLHFPRLRSLSLGTLVFGKDEQLEWILSHKALEHLSLDSCAICFHWEILSDAEWLRFDHSSLRRNDMSETQKEETGVEYTLDYDGRWSTYFDRIAAGLPKLRKFQIGYTWDPWGTHNVEDYRFDDRHKLGAELDPRRYVAFNSGIAEMQFMDPGMDETYIDLEFMNESPGKSGFEDEAASLDALLAAVRERNSA